MDELTVIAENLADADRLLEGGWKLRRAQLAELAAYLQVKLQTESESGEEAEQALTSLYGEFDEQLGCRVPIAETKEWGRAVSLFTRLELCRALSAGLAPHRVPDYSEPHPTIAYFQNPYAGRILQCVTDLLPDAEATDAEDYSDACEGVAEGRYDFCLLPVESAGDGVMNRFARLIDRYDLFTVLICHLELSEEEVKERVYKAAAFAGVNTDLMEKSPFDLSGGQKRRVAIAGIMAMEPEVLVLDEPAAGLDPQGRHTIFQGIREYNRNTGSTVLIVSHSMEDMAQYCDDVVVMAHSKVLMAGDRDYVFSRADELEDVGLDIPQVTKLCQLLRRGGMPIPAGLYTVGAAEDALIQIFSEAKEKKKGGNRL